MAVVERFKTNYPGVIYIVGTALGRSGKEKIYYIRYRRDGKQVEEKIGRQYADDMTPARAAGIRAQRIEGKQQSNQAQRDAKAEQAARWTIEKLWKEYSASKARGPNRTDKCNWEKHLLPTFGKKEPSELVKLDTDRLRLKLLKEKTPQTVRHVMALLVRIIKYGIKNGYVKPLEFEIVLPKVDNEKTEDLTPGQLQALLGAIENTFYQTAATMMKLALYTGMRRGEIFKLRWQDLDFHRGFIHIVAPKGKKSLKIPMNQSARALLESIPSNDSEYLFPARGGGPRKDIAKDLRAIKEQAGLPEDFRPMHGLRHVYATMLASSGKVDMYTLQKLMTHKSPQMTQRYAHFRDEALKRAAEQVDEIFKEAIDSRSSQK